MENQGKGKPSILLIDSNFEFLSSLEEAAGNCGFSVETPTDYSNLIREVEEMRPDVILLTEDDENFDVPGFLSTLRSEESISRIPVAIFFQEREGFPIHYELLKNGDLFIPLLHLAELLPSALRSLLVLGEGYEMKRVKEGLSFLAGLSEVLNSSLSHYDKLYVLVRRLASFLSLERSSIILKGSRGTSAYVVSTHDDPRIKSLRIDLDKYPEIVQAMETMKPVVISDIFTDPLLTDLTEILSRIELKSIMAVPIIIRERSSGSLLLNRKKGDGFSDSQVSLSSVVANMAADILNWCGLIHLVKSYDFKEEEEGVGPDGIVTISGEIEEVFEEVKEEGDE